MDTIINYIRNNILILCLFACALISFPPAFDRTLTTRHLLWCFFAIVMLLCNKELRIGKVAYCAFGVLFFSGISIILAINISEWLYSFLRCILAVTFLLLVDIDKKAIGKVFVILGCLFAVYFWYEFIKKGAFNEYRGLMGQRNYWAAAHFFVIPFCYYNYRNNIWKRLNLVIASLMVLHIVLLGSKSSLLALVVSSIIINRKLFLCLFCLLIAVFIINHKKLADSFYFRTIQWKATTRMIAENPWGVGAGNWIVNFPDYAHNLDYPEAYTRAHFRFPHNDYLWVWSEIGTLGLLCYLGMFVFGIRSADKFIVMFLLGYMTIAFFCALHERAFPSMLLVIMLALSEKQKQSIKKPQLLLSVLIFTAVVFAFRFRAAIYNMRLQKAKVTIEFLQSTKGYSVFSTLDYSGIPWHWWRGWSYYHAKKKHEALECFRMAYKYNPNNIQTINGMGIACAEKDKALAFSHFNKALDICPRYEEARINIEKLRNIKNVND